MGMSLTLYTNYLNSAGERVRIALALKEIDYDYVSVGQIGWDAYREINPQGLMPALKINDQIVAQSTAILEFLEENYSTRPLLPADPVMRARARAFAQHITSEMHAIDVIRVRRFLNKKLGVDESGIKLWQLHWFQVGFAALEEILVRRETAWPYCFGSEPGWADLHLVPQVAKGVTRFSIDMSSFPLIQGIFERSEAHPAFIAATPKMQPDYPGKLIEPKLK
jgi:maleylacetoacetate isomerase